MAGGGCGMCVWLGAGGCGGTGSGGTGILMEEYHVLTMAPTERWSFEKVVQDPRS